MNVTSTSKTEVLRHMLRSIFGPVLAPLWQRLLLSPLASRLLKGTFWAVLGTALSRVLGLCSAIFAARIIGKQHYGELGIIQNTVGMFGVLAGFGMGLTATKYVAEFRTTAPERAGRIITLSSMVAWVTSSALGAALLVLSPWLCRHMLNAPQLTSLMRAGALLLVLGGVNGAQTGALSGFEAFKRLAKVNLISGVTSFPVTLAGAWFFGMPGIVWALIISQAITCLLNFRALRREAKRYGIPLNYRACSAEMHILWKFSVPAVLAGLLVAPVNWACAAMLVRQPQGYVEMGAYNAANQWFNALLWLPTMLGQVVLPMLAERFGAKDSDRSGKLLWLSIRINGAIVLPVVLTGCVLSHVVMSFYGRDFSSGAPTLVAVLLTAGLMALMTPIGQMIAASGRMWLGFTMNCGWAFTFLISTWLLVGHGALGLASSRFLAYGAHSIWVFFYALRIIRRPKVDPSQEICSEVVRA